LGADGGSPDPGEQRAGSASRAASQDSRAATGSVSRCRPWATAMGWPRPSGRSWRCGRAPGARRADG
jgi:hypothetical protein